MNSASDSRLRRFNFYPYAAGVILGVALSLRLLGLDKGIWLDEYTPLQLTLQNSLLQLPLAARFSDTHPPLYLLLLKIWLSIGSGTTFARLLSVLLGISTIVIAMAWLKRYSAFASLAAGLGFAVLPIMLRYSQEIRNYGLLTFATTLSFFFASRLAATPGRRAEYVGLALCLTAAVTTHFAGVFVIVPICVFILLAAERERIRWDYAVPTFALPGVTFGAFYLLYQSLVSACRPEWFIPPVSFELILSTAMYLVGASHVSQVWLHSTWLDMALKSLWLVLAIGVVLGKDWRRSFPFLMAALIYWFETIAYSLVDLSVFWYRILLPSLVPLMAFVALQVASLRQRFVKFLALSAGVLLILIFAAAWGVSGAWKPIEEWEQVARHVGAAWQPNGVVIFYPMYVEAPIRYYLPDLPDQSVVSVRPHADLARVEKGLREKITAETTGLSVVVRADLTVQKDLTTYRQLLALLKSVPTRAGRLQGEVILASDVVICPDLVNTRDQLLADLEAEFGKVIWEEQSEGLASSIHNLHQVNR